MKDKRIFDEEGGAIYAGRGARSKRCREMINLGLAYVLDGEGELKPLAPETPKEPTISESAKKIQGAAEELADTLGVKVTGYEVRMESGDKTFIAELGIPSIDVVNGLTFDQLAEMANTIIGWMMNRGLLFHEYQELVEKVHRLLARHQLPRGTLQGMTPTVQEAAADARGSFAVNQIPGSPSNACFDELWILPGLMPYNHVCQPHFEGIDEIHTEDLPPLNEQHGMGNCRELWEGHVENVAPQFVCDNLATAARSRCLNRGANRVVRIFLHWEGQLADSISAMNYPNNVSQQYRDCLNRFIAHCSELKQSGDNSELRVIIYRPNGMIEEVSL
jgi:hypothetical protein